MKKQGDIQITQNFFIIPSLQDDKFGNSKLLQDISELFTKNSQIKNQLKNTQSNNYHQKNKYYKKKNFKKYTAQKYKGKHHEHQHNNKNKYYTSKNKKQKFIQMNHKKFSYQNPLFNGKNDQFYKRKTFAKDSYDNSTDKDNRRTTCTSNGSNDEDYYGKQSKTNQQYNGCQIKNKLLIAEQICPVKFDFLCQLVNGQHKCKKKHFCNAKHYKYRGECEKIHMCWFGNFCDRFLKNKYCKYYHICKKGDSCNDSKCLHIHLNDEEPISYIPQEEDKNSTYISNKIFQSLNK